MPSKTRCTLTIFLCSFESIWVHAVSFIKAMQKRSYLTKLHKVFIWNWKNPCRLQLASGFSLLAGINYFFSNQFCSLYECLLFCSRRKICYVTRKRRNRQMYSAADTIFVIPTQESVSHTWWCSVISWSSLKTPYPIVTVNALLIILVIYTRLYSSSESVVMDLNITDQYTHLK